jgi:hypothetical protein
MSSEILNDKALKALNTIGDIMIPAGEGFPSFSALGCIEHVDDVIRHAPEEDIQELATLLGLLAVCPKFIVRVLINSTEKARDKEGGLAPLLRLLNAALRGIIFTLYYSGKHGADYTGQTPPDIIGFELKCVPKN